MQRVIGAYLHFCIAFCFLQHSRFESADRKIPQNVLSIHFFSSKLLYENEDSNQK